MLTLRELNRATLERQMLRCRELSAAEATEQLVGMQPEASNPPYISLCTWLGAKVTAVP